MSRRKARPASVSLDAAAAERGRGCAGQAMFRRPVPGELGPLGSVGADAVVGEDAVAVVGSKR